MATVVKTFPQFISQRCRFHAALFILLGRFGKNGRGPSPLKVGVASEPNTWWFMSDRVARLIERLRWFEIIWYCIFSRLCSGSTAEKDEKRSRDVLPDAPGIQTNGSFLDWDPFCNVWFLVMCWLYRHVHRNSWANSGAPELLCQYLSATVNLPHSNCRCLFGWSYFWIFLILSPKKR